MEIVVDHVDFSYNHTPVLKDVSFTVSSGNMVTIVGPNGGGKTTLLKLLLGLLNPNRGTIRINGLPPEKARKKIGYVPQHAKFDSRFPITLEEVVRTGRMAKPFGFYRREDREAVDRALKEVGMEAELDTPFRELSGGQQQRALIARALAGEPELFFLDEPTANVDVAVEKQFSTLLKKLNQTLTVLLVTHDMGFVSSLTSRVFCVNHSVREHPFQEMNHDLVEDLYGGEMKLVRHDIDLSRKINGGCFDE